jgi:uncharacterized membrane protein YfcA
VVDINSVLLAAAIMAGAAFIHGYSGVGYGLVPMTVYSFLHSDLERLTVVISMISLCSFLLLFVLSTRGNRMDLGIFFPVSIGSILGVPLGYRYILFFHDRPLFKITLGAVILLVSLLSLSDNRLRHRLKRGWGVLFGFIGGFIGGAFISGGPVIALYVYSQVEDPRNQKGTLQAIFLVGIIVRLISVGIGVVGYTTDVLIMSSILVIPTSIMLILGHLLSAGFNVTAIKRSIFLFLCIFGIVIAINGFVPFM